jgi:hypothetical protein
MPLMEKLLIDYVRGYDWDPEPNEPVENRTYHDLIRAAPETTRYDWRKQGQQERAAKLTDKLVALGRTWGELPDPVPSTIPEIILSPAPAYEPWNPSKPFQCSAPRPRPAIRVVRDFWAPEPKNWRIRMRAQTKVQAMSAA